MRTISWGEISLSGVDALGRYAVAEVDGETVGVSVAGEDECVRDLADIGPGILVEVGTETMRVLQ